MRWRTFHVSNFGGAALGLARLFLAAMIIALGGGVATAAVRTIALSGQNPFTSGEMAGFSAFSPPSLNNRGQVAFPASLAGVDVTAANSTGLWIAGSGAFRTVGRAGEAAPGMPAGSVFQGISVSPTSTFFSVPISDAGDVAFSRFVQLPDSGTSSGIWATQGNALELRASQGGLAAGAVGGATYNSLSNNNRPTINRAGQVAFTATLTGAAYSSNNPQLADGIWVADATGADDVALVGQSATGAGTQAVFSSFPLSVPPLNRQGQVAFSAGHSLNNGAGPTGTSVWRGSGEGRELLGYSGQPIPELGPSATAQFSSGPAINGLASVATVGTFTGANGPFTTGSMIVLPNVVDPTIVAYTGGPAPGAGAGHVFETSFYGPSIGSGGQVAFYGSEWDGVNGASTHNGIWVGRPNGLELVARQGDPAPGANANFGNFIRDTPALNRFGQIAFLNTLTNVQPGTMAGTIWATDLNGNPTLIARQGETIEVAPGDVRTISTLNMLTNHGDDDGRPRGLNDLGQVAFVATFVGGTSGVFVSNAVAHLPGDYNLNGVVDAADYTVWRNALATQSLAADGTLDGSVDGADYDLWKEFFGVSLNLASGSGALAVPEPGTGWLAVLLFAGIAGTNTRRRSTRAVRPADTAS